MDEPGHSSLSNATITVPLGKLPNSGYELQQSEEGKIRIGQAAVHINAQLGREQAITFLRIRDGLRKSNARLGDGKPVWTNVETLKWVLEQMMVK